MATDEEMKAYLRKLVDEKIGVAGLMEIYRRCARPVEDGAGVTFEFLYLPALDMIKDMLCD